jgi:hypothetical protein
VDALQPRHCILQSLYMSKDSAASAGPTLNALLALELHEGSPDVHDVRRLDLQRKVVEGVYFDGSLRQQLDT